MRRKITRLLQRLHQDLLLMPKTRQELKILLETLSLKSDRKVIDHEVIPMFEGVMQLSEVTAREVMVSHSNMVVLRRNDDLASAISTIRESGHSRFPLIAENLDSVDGIVLAKELLGAASNGKKERFDWKDFQRSPFFIPETKTIDAVLKDFQRTRSHMVIVANEYGSVAGLLTLEDVLEVIVGEITDESEKDDKQQIIKIDAKRYLIDPRTSLVSLNKELSLSINNDTQDTVAGYLFEKLGRMPKNKDIVIFEKGQFEVVLANKRGVERIRLTLSHGG